MLLMQMSCDIVCTPNMHDWRGLGYLLRMRDTQTNDAVAGFYCIVSIATTPLITLSPQSTSWSGPSETPSSQEMASETFLPRITEPGQSVVECSQQHSLFSSPFCKDLEPTPFAPMGLPLRLTANSTSSVCPQQAIEEASALLLWNSLARLRSQQVSALATTSPNSVGLSTSSTSFSENPILHASLMSESESNVKTTPILVRNEITSAITEPEKLLEECSQKMKRVASSEEALFKASYEGEQLDTSSTYRYCYEPVQRLMLAMSVSQGKPTATEEKQILNDEAHHVIWRQQQNGLHATQRQSDFLITGMNNSAPPSSSFFVEPQTLSEGKRDQKSDTPKASQDLNEAFLFLQSQSKFKNSDD